MLCEGTVWDHRGERGHGGAQGGGGAKGFSFPLCVPLGSRPSPPCKPSVASMGLVRGFRRLQALPSRVLLLAAGILDIDHGEDRSKALCRW